MIRISGYLLVLTILFSGCQNTQSKRFAALKASQTGINFENTLTESLELNILNYLYFYNGAGVAAADFNNDGLVDLYFTANQEADQLYLNEGGFQFINVTEEANINNAGNWTTGVTHVDINHDGLLDIYICKIGNYRTIKGKNLLYVNQGVNEEGIPEFKEDAASYGLDFSGFSTQAAFFDYDLDGDLDMFLLNHSVHPNITYGKGSQRLRPDPSSGDRLFKNENGYFTDVSEEAGIFQGRIGYGLGLTVSDLNNDTYPDLYIGNDFFENDYLYINNKDGSFKELISSNINALGHTTHFSMGNDIADINNDGLVDIVSLDMLPEDLETYKTSGLEYPFPTYQYYLKNGYAPQYMQNTLHLNLGNESFSEIGQLSGISATEWSWSALLADFDNDTFKDLYITNGIKRATNDMDFISFIANESIQKRLEKGMSAEDMEFIEEIPQKKASNYFLRNKGNLSFEDATEVWYEKRPTFSNGAVYADLDNDGDLDIVVNNVDGEAMVLENNTRLKNDTNFTKVTFQGDEQNPFGIGARVYTFLGKQVQTQENFVTRGFLSAVPAGLTFGLGKQTNIDSVQVVWPNGKSQILYNIAANKEIIFKESEAKEIYSFVHSKSEKLNVHNAAPSINFRHKEPPTLEFNRDPLVPFANTNEGPAIAVADVNKDGKDDIFISGAKAQASQLFLQREEGNFELVQEDIFLPDALNEDVSQVFFDANGDSWPDLLVVSAGNEFQSGARLRPRLYINNKGLFKRDTLQFQAVELNASKVAVHDLENDGDLDVLIAADQTPLQFGSSARQYVFLNDGTAKFLEDTSDRYNAFKTIPSVKDFLWADMDNDGEKDLITAGYWEPITILKNKGGVLDPLKDSSLETTNGLWNVIKVCDFDKDGDLDILAGNWGLNSRLKASGEHPITLYRADFDENGTIDPVVTYFEGGIETPFASKDELAKQMPFLNKEFLSYASFAKADLNTLFSKEKLSKAEKKQLYELKSIYLVNDGQGHFTREELPLISQASITHEILIEDLNNDDFEDLMLVGNSFEISTQLGRMDASHGIILLNDKKGHFYWVPSPDIDISGPARNIEKLRVNQSDYFIIGINNDTPIFLIKNKDKGL
ncbi:MAG: VCBS repeat-containing protein [Eudoraea sp.]|nr:VCBS repeat-containing protein [Eudoraea sp.]